MKRKWSTYFLNRRIFLSNFEVIMVRLWQTLIIKHKSLMGLVGSVQKFDSLRHSPFYGLDISTFVG